MQTSDLDESIDGHRGDTRWRSIRRGCRAKLKENSFTYGENRRATTRARDVTALAEGVRTLPMRSKLSEAQDQASGSARLILRAGVKTRDQIIELDGAKR